LQPEIFQCRIQLYSLGGSVERRDISRLLRNKAKEPFWKNLSEKWGYVSADAIRNAFAREKRRRGVGKEAPPAKKEKKPLLLRILIHIQRQMIISILYVLLNA